MTMMVKLRGDAVAGYDVEAFKRNNNNRIKIEHIPANSNCPIHAVALVITMVEALLKVMYVPII